MRRGPAPPGAEVGLYVDLAARVAPDEVIQTESGRRYLVIRVRVQERGRYRGRQHLRAIVCDVDDVTGDRRVHRIRWYRR